tara:strand:- start:147 stop:614 length:468 start_codon:yes stop_codon:yes gene_type:complete
MARIIEYITVNYAVSNESGILQKFKALGLEEVEANIMPDPPAQIKDVTFPIGEQGAFSIVTPTDSMSTVQKFLDRRGDGVFSIAVRVDNLAEAMEEWRQHGIEWVLPKPYIFPPGTNAARYRVEKLIANWIKPGSLNGLLMECFQFCGSVEQFTK